jgi:hypothetical protein
MFLDCIYVTRLKCLVHRLDNYWPGSTLQKSSFSNTEMFLQISYKLLVALYRHITCLKRLRITMKHLSQDKISTWCISSIQQESYMLNNNIWPLHANMTKSCHNLYSSVDWLLHPSICTTDPIQDISHPLTSVVHYTIPTITWTTHKILHATYSESEEHGLDTHKLSWPDFT